MSGGYFDYGQYNLIQYADEIKSVRENNGSGEKDEWGGLKHTDLTEATMAAFALGEHYLRLAQVYMQRIDWLLSGDDGEEQFHSRLSKDILEYTNGTGKELFKHYESSLFTKQGE